MSNFAKVKKFMEAFGQEVLSTATIPSEKIIDLRKSLIDEEVGELHEAIRENDIVQIADALTDILYVVYGAGHACGINLDKCFEEVHNSNMSKLGDDGKPVLDKNNFDKVIKGPNYFKPDLSQFVYPTPKAIKRKK
jgi:predicted HAD superfamily Cof-like phosphohydrolase